MSIAGRGESPAFFVRVAIINMRRAGSDLVEQLTVRLQIVTD